MNQDLINDGPAGYCPACDKLCSNVEKHMKTCRVWPLLRVDNERKEGDITLCPKCGFRFTDMKKHSKGCTVGDVWGTLTIVGNQAKKLKRKL